MFILEDGGMVGEEAQAQAIVFAGISALRMIQLRRQESLVDLPTKRKP